MRTEFEHEHEYEYDIGDVLDELECKRSQKYSPCGSQHGADVVLLVKGISQTDRYTNGLAIFSLLILPAYVGEFPR